MASGPAGERLQLGLGAVSFVLGAEALIVPGHFTVLAPTDVAGVIPAWGAAILVCGIAQISATVIDLPRQVEIAAGLGNGVLLLAMLIMRAGALFDLFGQQVTPNRRDLIDIGIVGIIGIALVTRPLLRGRLPSFDGHSLHARLLFVLVMAASLPLILAVSTFASAAQSTAIDLALSDQKTAASHLAAMLDQYNQTYRVSLGTIAARAGLEQLSSDSQRQLLEKLVMTDVYAFSTYDNSGRTSARSDDLPSQDLPHAVVSAIADGHGPATALSTVPGSERPELLFAAPLILADGSLAGFVAAEVQLAQFAEQVQRAAQSDRQGMIVKIVDASGRAVVNENPTLVGAGADLSQEPPVAMAFASSGAGALEFRTPHGPMVAGYARVSSLGWVAVTEYPAATVLAGVTAGRFMGFGVLIAALVSSTVIAMLVTSHLVQPLNELGRAVGSLADDEVSRALPRSTFSEIRWLAAMFGGMRDRLAARTAERERALTQAREAVRVRDQFLSVAAHELKTPVTAIRGYAALLRRRVVSNSLTGDELCTALLRIERQSYALGRLTEHLLDLASLEEGKLALNCQTMDLRDVLINAVAGTPYSERIRMSLPDVPREGSFDTLRLGQALRNLLDNAVKFGPADTYIELSLDGHDDKARIQVSDTGEGIPIEHRARVFERLHQAHSDSHRSGLGLGLYLAREIVELHGGSIGVEFPAAGGTRFFLDLPLGTAAEIHSGVESL